MTTLIHSSPLGALEIAGVPGLIAPGEPFNVDELHALTLLQQSDLYALAEPESSLYDGLKLSELKTLTDERELTVDGTTKRDHIAALVAADAATA